MAEGERAPIKEAIEEVIKRCYAGKTFAEKHGFRTLEQFYDGAELRELGDTGTYEDAEGVRARAKEAKAKAKAERTRFLALLSPEEKGWAAQHWGSLARMSKDFTTPEEARGLLVAAGFVAPPIAAPATPKKRARLGVNATSEASNEGIGLDWPIKSLREETCADLLQLLDKRRVILIRAPPFSGKTSLGTLLQHRATQQGLEAIRVTMLGFTDTDRLSNFLHTFDVETAMFAEFVKPTYLIVDEAQLAYRDSNDPFWQMLKLLAQSPSGELRVLLLAAYGGKIGMEATPIDLQLENAPGVDLVLFRDREFNDVVSSYNVLAENAKTFPEIEPKTARVISKFSGNHPGITMLILEEIKLKFANQPTVPQKEIASYVLSDEIASRIRSSRAFPALQNSEQRTYLAELLQSPRYERKPPIHTHEEQELVKMGAISMRNYGRVVCFPSPAVRIAYTWHVFRSSSGPRGSMVPPSSLMALLMGALQRMRCDVLQRTFGVCSDGLPSERTWQMEFYWGLSAFLPSTLWISPDVGFVFGATGLADFYVDSVLKLVLELLREGDDIQGHLDRFTKGAYADIEMKDYAVIDFRAASKSFHAFSDEHLWRVCYADDFSTFTLVHGTNKYGGKFAEN